MVECGFEPAGDAPMPLAIDAKTKQMRMVTELAYGPVPHPVESRLKEAFCRSNNVVCVQMAASLAQESDDLEASPTSMQALGMEERAVHTR